MDLERIFRNARSNKKCQECLTNDTERPFNVCRDCTKTFHNVKKAHIRFQNTKKFIKKLNVGMYINYGIRFSDSMVQEIAENYYQIQHHRKFRMHRRLSVISFIVYDLLNKIGEEQDLDHYNSRITAVRFTSISPEHGVKLLDEFNININQIYKYAQSQHFD